MQEMFPIDQEQRLLFRSRQLEAIAWCNRVLRIGDPAGSLRTASLKPSLVTIEAANAGSWNYEVEDPRAEVDHLCQKRASLLKAEQILPGRSTDPSENGRILLFYPHETLCDGAAYESSKGFFDRWNIPPWDTWFWYARLPDQREVLYSWVPEEYEQLAEIGVSVNPEQCIQWLDETVFPEGTGEKAETT